MKSILSKLGYTLLAIVMAFMVTGIISAIGYPGFGAAVFFIGLPYLIYLIWRKAKPAQTHTQIPVEVEIKMSMNPPRTVNVESMSYAIPKAPRSKYRFLGKEERINLHGFDMPGLIYAGTTPSSQYEDEPAIIFQKLPVQKKALAERLGYWPNYSQLNPAQRGRYLEWLSSGRGEIDELGYVFLYFYGFERYVLRDAANDSAELREQNLQSIVSEVVRLRKLFGENKSFDSYSNQLLDVIYVVFWPSKINERKSVFPSSQSVAAHFAIAQAANSGSEMLLDSDWALHWLLGFGPVSRTKTIREQYPILRSLFHALYMKETQGGIKVPTCKAKLKIFVNTASRGLDDVALIPVPENWCDPTELKRPMTQLLSVNDKVMPALRALAKAVAKKDIAGILCAWPQGVPTDSVPKLKQIIDRMCSFAQTQEVIELPRLGKMLGIEITDKPTPTQHKQIAAAIQTCGLVLVPDPTLTGSSLQQGETVILYSGLRLSDLSPEGKWLVLTIQLGCLLAATDGAIHAHEKEVLTRTINSHSNSQEREYLLHYLEWRLTNPPGTAGLKKQIDTMDDTQKAEIARILAKVAMADGDIATNEVKQMEKLFTRLGLDAVLVGNYLSVPAENRIKSEPTQKPKDTFSLDEAALRAHADSTKEIQSVLQKIFVDVEEIEVDQTITESPTTATWHEGRLDSSHEALVAWLLTGQEWSMDLINSKCQELGLMPQGALEAINDAAFETLGDGLLEIGDTVEVYSDVMPA